MLANIFDYFVGRRLSAEPRGYRVGFCVDEEEADALD